jgi:DNA replication protein DnaC
MRACLGGHRALFATATEWITRLGEAQRGGRLEAELKRLDRIPLLVIDEVGCAPRGAMRPGGQRGPPPAAATAG